MIKKYLPIIAITAAITLLPMIFGIVAWDKLPENMPIHFNSSGEADDFGSRAMAVFALPLAMLLIHIICAAVTLIDPKRRNIDGKPFKMVLWICPLMSLLVCGLMYAYAFGLKINIATAILIALGILFIVLGNYMPKCGQNYSIGIKTPWALNSEKNWSATHRFAGKIFVATGFVTIILAFFAMRSSAFFWVYFAIQIAAGLAPELYSLVYYLRFEKKK